MGVSIGGSLGHGHMFSVASNTTTCQDPFPGVLTTRSHISLDKISLGTKMEGNSRCLPAVAASQAYSFTPPAEFLTGYVWLSSSSSAGGRPH